MLPVPPASLTGRVDSPSQACHWNYSSPWERTGAARVCVQATWTGAATAAAAAAAAVLVSVWTRHRGHAGGGTAATRALTSSAKQQRWRSPRSAVMVLTLSRLYPCGGHDCYYCCCLRLLLRTKALRFLCAHWRARSLTRTLFPAELDPSARCRLLNLTPALLYYSTRAAACCSTWRFLSI